MSGENQNRTKEAEDCLFGRYVGACRLLDHGATPTSLKITPPLDRDEARYFVKGLEEALFSVDSEGYVQSMMLPLSPVKNRKQKVLQLFWAVKNGRVLFREGVCQLATVSSLVFKYGWNRDRIEVEPSKREFRDLAYGVDILIRDNAKKVVVCVEVKRSQPELERLIEGFRYCCQLGRHTKDQCDRRFRKNHSKYAFCSKIGPEYLFATAPGGQICFKLTCTVDGAVIQEEQRDLIYGPAD